VIIFNLRAQAKPPCYRDLRLTKNLAQENLQTSKWNAETWRARIGSS
jgi:hypothetical protein